MPATPATYPMAFEDYVKVIYAHTEWQPEPITSSVLAGRLGLAASSVTEMVKKLGANGLVDHVRYGAITLTPDGAALALRMLRRHRLIETWLVQHYGYAWDEVHDEAEVLEHALSDRLLDKIDDELGRPTRDPHGDPIPSKAGVISQPAALLLRDAVVGERVVVVRISDRDSLLLRHLEAESVVLDRALEVRSRDPFVVQLEVQDGERTLAPDALVSIWVSREEPSRVK
ncbi:DtxR family Mn-dependent transcriptional regulator [Conyzicola lurida]|uniref:Manganese transport regulator n=1 Tax=Conyzicola lurida TaxID=1172621 RepID=A0A841AH35_9MICO|nr:metal-dependent transcriptional regulator [Conyzicola lurida]MBB5842527.1 DtxR family Mn-dependent transcriptional regulator [Conyzicola lurida]